MNTTEHVRASTEPGPLGLLLWALTVVLAVACSAITGPWFVPVAVAIGCLLILIAWALCRMEALCDEERCTGCMDSQGRQCECRESLRTDIEPWHMPHMNNQPNDARL